MENANIKSISNINQRYKLEIKFIAKKNTINLVGNYSKMGNDDIWEWVSEVEIGKLVSLGYFDSQ